MTATFPHRTAVSAADRLREAARVLRERAEAAQSVIGTGWYSVSMLEEMTVEPEVAPFINHMHPGVGLALADLLDTVAHHVGTFDCEAHCEPDGCSTVRESDRIADLILGGAS